MHFVAAVLLRLPKSFRLSLFISAPAETDREQPLLPSTESLPIIPNALLHGTTTSSLVRLSIARPQQSAFSTFKAALTQRAFLAAPCDEPVANAARYCAYFASINLPNAETEKRPPQ